MQRFLLVISLVLASACLTAEPPGDLPTPNRSPATGPSTASGITGVAEIQTGVHRFVGPQSCMATACHGQIPFQAAPATAMRGGEFAFWRQYDPHSGAAETLHQPESQRMLEALGVLGEDRDPAAVRADIATRCGVCHSPDPPQHLQSDSYVGGQGVSCEACHGAAHRWRDTHYRHKESGSLAFHLAGGRANTKQPHVRAAVCVACHVGSAHGSVGHDLIAAGHPVLQFELASYYNRLPKHWDDQADRARHPKLDFELWAHGQLAGARASASLLARRSAKIKSLHQLDFAEFDCYACHHDLHPAGWPLAPQSGGLLRRGQWNWVFAGPVASSLEDVALGAARQRLDTLLGQANGNPVEINKMARQLADIPIPLTVPQTTIVLQEIQRWLDSDAEGWSWDRAAQTYLALSACYLAGPADDALERQLIALRDLLLFPKAYNSPRGLGSYRSSKTPAPWTQVQPRIQELLTGLAR